MQSSLVKSFVSRKYLIPGAIAGLTGGWAIFGLLLAIDVNLGFQPGTFYELMGLAFGVDPSYSVYFGFIAHMAFAVLLGIAFVSISFQVKKLNINSVLKGVATGLLTGVVIWGAIFVPINYLLMEPALQNIVATNSPETKVYNVADKLLQLGPSLVVGALALHLVFGGVLGFCGRLAAV